MCPTKKKFRWFKWLLIALAISLPFLYVLFITTAQSQIKKELDKIRAAGYPANCIELDAWYKQVPADENGAEVVLEAIDQLVKWKEKYIPFRIGVSAEMAELAKAYGITDVEITDTPSDNFPKDWQVKNKELLPLINREIKLPNRTASMSDLMKALITDYLSDNSEALETLHTTTEFSKSRYPVDLKTGFAALMPYLGDIRLCAKMLSLETALHSDNNQPDKAIESFKTTFAVAKTLNDEPILISYLVKIGCDNLAIRSLEYMFNHTELNSEHLNAIDQALKGPTARSNIKRAFAGERCFGISCFNNPAAAMTGTGSAPISALKATGLLNKDFLAYLDLMGRQIKAMDLPLSQRKKTFQQIESDTIALPWYCFLTKMVMPALGKSVEMHYRHQTLHQLAQTTCAIEQYRLANNSKLPGELTDLVPTYLQEVPTDPFDETPIKYIKLEKGYTLYSIGEDRTDNGGKELNDEGRRFTDGTDVTFSIEK